MFVAPNEALIFIFAAFYQNFAPNRAKAKSLSAHQVAKPQLVSCNEMIALKQVQADEIVAHARAAAPHECCGLIGGQMEGEARSIYRTRNIASDPLITYEAAPEDLFAAQRTMRERGEQLIAIYHSHPRSSDPEPSPTDVRLAYYPSAVYFIVGLGDQQPCLRAFRISEREGRWDPVKFEIVADANP